MAKRGKALFKSICLGKCKSRDLPARLNLSSLAPEMNRLWKASIRDIESGVVREHAALLIWERERLRLTNIVEGTDGEVEPDFQLLPSQRFVGTFHTHPYTTGWMGVGFSGEDFASALFYQENLSILHSGSRVMALARTELTPNFVDEEEVARRAEDILKMYRRITTFSRAVLKMNLAICEKYGMGFYIGETAGKLNLDYRP